MTNLKKQESDMSTYLGEVQAVIEEFDTFVRIEISISYLE